MTMSEKPDNDNYKTARSLTKTALNGMKSGMSVDVGLPMLEQALELVKADTDERSIRLRESVEQKMKRYQSREPARRTK